MGQVFKLLVQQMMQHQLEAYEFQVAAAQQVLQEMEAKNLSFQELLASRIS